MLRSKQFQNLRKKKSLCAQKLTAIFSRNPNFQKKQNPNFSPKLNSKHRPSILNFVAKFYYFFQNSKQNTVQSKEANDSE